MAKLGITKDIDLDVNGRLVKIEGNDKIRQQVLKALVTQVGSNSIFPGYGSNLSSVIGQKFDTLAEFKLHNSVQQAIRFLIQEQLQQANLPLNETILGILNIQVGQDRIDPRIIRVVITVQTGDFNLTEIAVGLVNQ